MFLFLLGSISVPVKLITMISKIVMITMMMMMIMMMIMIMMRMMMVIAIRLFTRKNISHKKKRFI